jgi:hypothetical protein
MLPQHTVHSSRSERGHEAFVGEKALDNRRRQSRGSPRLPRTAITPLERETAICSFGRLC